jgi:predicted esterase
LEGFSDGASYALGLGLTNGDLFDGGHTVPPEIAQDAMIFLFGPVAPGAP